MLCWFLRSLPSWRVLRPTCDVHGVLVRLFAEFVRAQVICFPVCDRSRLVSVGRKVVELCDSIVRTLWHGVLLSRLDDDGCSRGMIRFYAICLAGVPIFFRYVVFRHFTRSDLRHVRILGVFHTVYGIGFECVSLLY